MNKFVVTKLFVIEFVAQTLSALDEVVPVFGLAIPSRKISTKIRRFPRNAWRGGAISSIRRAQTCIVSGWEGIAPRGTLVIVLAIKLVHLVTILDVTIVV